jgi:argininosuccinate lyase
VRWCLENKRSLASLTKDEWRKLAPDAGDELPSLLAPEISAARRDTLGGASPKQVRVQAERGREKLDGLSSEFEECRESCPELFA